METAQKATESLTQLTESISDVIANAKKAWENNPRPWRGECADGNYEDPPTDQGWDGKDNGIPRLYAGCNFDTYQGNDGLVLGLRELMGEDCNILLMGKTGCGKTHLAVSILKAAMQGRFVTAPDLLLEIRSSFNGGTTTEGEIITRYSECPLLVIDDLGAEKTSEYSITTLYIIIDRRIRDMKKTIITTNLNHTQIEETLGARIASRLAGMENIRINMPDFRKKR